MLWQGLPENLKMFEYSSLESRLNLIDLKANLELSQLRMRPYTYEASLLKLQFEQRQGIFACGGHDVFSNQEPRES